MLKKGGLGRGLGSLIPNKKIIQKDEKKVSTSSSDNKKDQVEDFKLPLELKKQTLGKLISEIPLGQITPNTHQPRHYFDDKALGELADSIKENGILQPLVVNKIAQNKFEIIAGERRFLASKKAGLETVPAIVRNVNQQQKLEIAIIENIQREDLSPLEEAESYLRLNNEFSLTHEQIAKQVSKSRAQITNLIRLLVLPTRLKEALTAGQITVGHAKMLASLSTQEEQLELFKTILRKQLSVRETERVIVKIKAKSSNFKNRSLKDPNLIEKEELLREALGTKVNIKNRGAKGKVEIEYYSIEELDNIIEKIIELKS